MAHLKSVLSEKDKQIEIYKLYVNHEYPPSKTSSGNVSGCNSFMGSPDSGVHSTTPAATSSEHLMNVFYDLEEQRDRLKELQNEREAASNFMIPINLQDFSPH